jgi:hypothetical protein
MARTRADQRMDKIAAAKELVVEFGRVTRELSVAASGDLDGVEQILASRSAILVRIAAVKPRLFSAVELASLRDAQCDADAALHKLLLVRCEAAGEWQRLNPMRSREPQPEGTISLSA